MVDRTIDHSGPAPIDTGFILEYKIRTIIAEP